MTPAFSFYAAAPLAAAVAAESSCGDDGRRPARKAARRCVQARRAIASVPRKMMRR